MSSQKLSPADRKEAKNQIQNHFQSKHQPMLSAEDVARNLCNELETKHESLLSDIHKAQKTLNALKGRLKRKLPQHFSLSGDLNIVVDYNKKYKVSAGVRTKISKKNAPIEKAEQKQLAKLQVAETREDLNKIYKSLGIL